MLKTENAEKLNFFFNEITLTYQLLPYLDICWYIYDVCMCTTSLNSLGEGVIILTRNYYVYKFSIDGGGLVVEKSSLCAGRMASRSFSKTVRYDRESKGSAR